MYMIEVYNEVMGYWQNAKVYEDGIVFPLHRKIRICEIYDGNTNDYEVIVELEAD